MGFERILDGLSNAFESISDRLRNAPKMRLWQRILQTRWPGPPRGAAKKRRKKKGVNLEYVDSFGDLPLSHPLAHSCVYVLFIGCLVVVPLVCRICGIH